MKKLISILLFSILSVCAYSQIHLNNALKAQIYTSTGTSPNFIVNALVSDDLSAFNATDVATGQYLYVIDGSFCYELVIDSILFQSGTLLQIKVIDEDSVLSNVPLGQGAIIETYPNFDLPTYISTLRDDLQSCIIQKLVSRIDAIVGSGIGQNNIGANVGSGTGIYQSKQDTALVFKSLVEGDNINITSSSTEITINANPTLSYSDDTLSISEGNSVIIPLDSLYNIVLTTIGAQPPPTLVYLPSHGFTLPTKGYIPINQNYELANSSHIDSVQIAYIIGVPHPDSLEIVTGGVITTNSYHGLDIGALYYLNDNGTEDAVDDGTVSSSTAFVLDSLNISLREIGLILERFISFRPIPSPVITGYGGNPLNPSDSIVGLIATNLYKPLGLVTAGTILTTPYTGASVNKRYQATNPLGQSYNGSNVWIYDGQNYVTRLKEKLFALNMQDSAFSSQTLIPITCFTDSCAIEWFNVNYNNGIRLPNGFIGYVVGNGSVNSPEHIWMYTDNHNSLFEDGVIRLGKNSTWLKPELEAGDVSINSDTAMLEFIMGYNSGLDGKPAIRIQHENGADERIYIPLQFRLNDTVGFEFRFYDETYFQEVKSPFVLIAPLLSLNINGSTGTAGQALIADGSGNASWSNVSATDTSGYNTSFTVLADSLQITDGNSTLSVALSELRDGNGVYSATNNNDTLRVAVSFIAPGSGFTIVDTSGTSIFDLTESNATLGSGNSFIQAIKPLGYLLMQGDSLLFNTGGSFGTAGQVMTATGSGGAFWQDAQEIDSLTTSNDTLFLNTSSGTFFTVLPQSESTLAGNGLTMSGDTVKLGGVLTENTTITGGNFGLTVTRANSVSSFTASNSSTGTAITGSAGVGYGVLGSSSAVAVQGNSSSSGTPAIVSRNNGANTDAVTPGLRLERATTGTAANGIGSNIAYNIETTTGDTPIAAELETVYTNATNASRTARFNINTVNSATVSRKLSLSGPGQLTLDGYSTNNFIGTGWARLAVQSDGTVVADTTSTPGGGGTTIDSLTYANDTLSLYTSDGTFTAGIVSSGGGVQYSDSLTVFVTPTMLADTALAIRNDFPINTDDQALSIDSTGRVFTISLTDGGSVTFQDTDTDNQTLSISNDTLSISGGNSVTLNNIFTAGNGLTKTGNNIKLGGTLTEHTAIAGNAKDLEITSLRKFQISGSQSPYSYNFGRYPNPFDPDETALFGVRVNDLTIGRDTTGDSYVGLRTLTSGLNRGFQWRSDSTDRIEVYNFGTGSTGFKGLVYNDNYTANFITNSLITKGYADQIVADSSAAIRADIPGSQTLSISNDTLSISGGNSVVLPGGADGNGIYGGSGTILDTSTIVNIQGKELFFRNNDYTVDFGVSDINKSIYSYVESGSNASLLGVSASQIDVNTTGTILLPLVPKDNSYNRILVQDSLTRQLKYMDKSSISGGGGGGTVTSVGSGYGLSGGPITSAGTLSVDTTKLATLLALQDTAAAIRSDVAGNIYTTNGTITDTERRVQIPIDGEFVIDGNGVGDTRPELLMQNTEDAGYVSLGVISTASQSTIEFTPTYSKISGAAGGAFGVNQLNPTRTVDINGDLRVRDLTTTTADRLVAADADGVISSVSAGSGITISGGTISASGGGGATDLTFTGSSSPVTLNSSSGTDVRFVRGTGITLAAAGDSLVINSTAVQPPATENIESSTFTALAGIINQVDCSGGARTVNPPSSPTIGMRFAVVDATASAASNNITVDFDSASQNLYGSEQTYILNVNGAYVEFIYMGATTGWVATKG